ncbi:MAG: LytTR family DNA-binding domain-containing protein [Pseudomonadota bacterium]|nr:LytTR family DNA-binding domain-containing protein [Pseudomonadota bacterium]
MRERRQAEYLAVEAAIVLSVAALAAMIGPFGTFVDMTVVERIQYWFGIVALNWLQVRAIRYGLDRLGGGRFPLATTVAGALLASIPATFEVFWLERHFRPEAAGVPPFLWLYPQIAILTLAISLPVFRILQNRDRAAMETADIAVPPPPSTAPAGESLAGGEPPASASRFLERLPDRLGDTIHCLQAEDHYVRVYTPAGNDLVLHRFSDAVAELDGIDGLQVHRSWWIARAAVDDVVRRERKIFLKLGNGLEVPVSRRFVPDLREAGWLS